MRRPMLMLAMVIVALVVASGAAFAATIRGTDGDDFLEGTRNDDRIYGRGANDTVEGYGGNDRLFGNDGNDVLAAMRERDNLFGGIGEDALQGGKGRDELNGGDGDDTYGFGMMYEGLGNVHYYEHSWGDDTIAADASGTDTLDFFYYFEYRSGVVVDLVATATGDEAKRGKSTLNFPATVEIENVYGTHVSYSPDVVHGSPSDNLIRTFDGDDEVHGRGGDDDLGGGYGDDTIYGDEGGDTIDVADGDAGDSVDCGPGTDTVEVDATIPEGDATPVPTDHVVNCETVNPVT
jgi:Ca2+-binding RTX toxin-like protein